MKGAPQQPRAGGYKWQLFRSGGTEQVVIKTAEDIFALEHLDQKLWLSLGMPTKGVDFDPKTLAYLDTNKDSRVQATEVVAAVKWLREVLEKPEVLIKGGDSVPLAALKDGPVLKSARRVLAGLGKADAEAISLTDVSDSAKVFAETRFNGDGIIHAGSSDDAEVIKSIEDVIAIKGSVPDLSGKPGIDKARVDAFFADVQSYMEWLSKGKAEPGILPLGDATAPAAAAVAAVRTKVVDYFTRCHLLAFDPRASVAAAGTEADLAALGAAPLSAQAEGLQKLPLAAAAAGRPLPLGHGVNPAWSQALDDLRTKAVEPILGSPRKDLTETDWNTVTAKLAAYDAWAATKPTTEVEKLGEDRIKALSEGGKKEILDGLIAEDLALEPEYKKITDVEKLVLYVRDFHRFCRNYVNFSDLYSLKGAAFQAGTLFLDARACDLCIEVLDAAKHGPLASLSGCYLAYCDLTRMGPGGPEKKAIVAAFTNGDADALMVGRNGLFYDREGNDWAATITKIVSNPISLREAFWSPYKKLSRMIEEQIAKRASAAETQQQQRMSASTQAAIPGDPKAPTKTPEPPKKIDVGTVAAIGVAVGGIGAMVVGILAAFLGLGKWLPLGIVGLLLLISAPSMILAYVKLRHRSLGPLLDASGWAINGRANINVPFGAALTRLASLPPGARHAFADPYAEKKRPWWLYITLLVILVVALLWFFGKVDRYLPDSAKSTKVLGKHAPGYVAPKPDKAAAPAAPGAPAAAPAATPAAPAPAMAPAAPAAPAMAPAPPPAR
jgi:hypothetical protein